MFVRKFLIQKNINFEDVKDIISHHWSSLIFPVIKNIFFLSIVYIFFVILKKYYPAEKIMLLAGILGIILLFKFLVDFLNVYLDGIVLSKEGITFFLWEGLLHYQSESFEWDKILAVNHSKNGLMDKLFNKGNLIINLHEDVEFPFENVPNPKKQVDKILMYKKMYGSSSEVDKLEKYKMLAEIFAEVMEESKNTGGTD